VFLIVVFLTITAAVIALLAAVFLTGSPGAALFVAVLVYLVPAGSERH